MHPNRQTVKPSNRQTQRLLTARGRFVFGSHWTIRLRRFVRSVFFIATDECAAARAKTNCRLAANRPRLVKRPPARPASGRASPEPISPLGFVPRGLCIVYPTQLSTVQKLRYMLQSSCIGAKSILLFDNFAKL